MLRRVVLVRTDVSEELSASVIRVTRIGELGTTLAVTSNRRTLQEPYGVTYQKTVFFIVTAMNTKILQELKYLGFRSLFIDRNSNEIENHVSKTVPARVFR
jgi:hypothetical protein